uniref:Uncharacterized protein n=1 Tax=Buteo japonicus TaxID=224669 RepID=A0A8C0BYW1_9AVES
MPGMLATGHSDSAAWPVAFLAGEPSCVSWGLWMLAALCWIAARSLLSCECPGQGHRQPSVLCLLYSFLGHVCNTVGALLASQLGIQILTSAYMAMADVVRFLLTLFPLCPPESHKTAGLCRYTPPCHRCRLAATCSEPRVLGRQGFCWDVCAGLSPDPFSGQAVKGFPCFSCFFSLPQDNREALGFVLGLLSAFVALTARIPALSRAVSVCWAWLPLCPPVPGRVPQP